jgi:DNA repair protein RadC
VNKDYATLSDQELLGKFIGVREARRLYSGTLQPLFSEGTASTKLLVARELVRRLLPEELSRGCALTSPVRDYLKLILGDRDHEVFVCLWLDAQHRVIRTDRNY